MLVIKSKKKWSEWETMIIPNKSNLYIICRQAAVTKEKFCLPFVYISQQTYQYCGNNNDYEYETNLHSNKHYLHVSSSENKA